jgi:hypothetical protein
MCVSITTEKMVAVRLRLAFRELNCVHHGFAVHPAAAIDLNRVQSHLFNNLYHGHHSAHDNICRRSKHCCETSNHTPNSKHLLTSTVHAYDQPQQVRPEDTTLDRQKKSTITQVSIDHDDQHTMGRVSTYKTSKYSRARDISWVREPMFDGSVYPKNLMQMFEYLLVLRYSRPDESSEEGAHIT